MLGMAEMQTGKEASRFCAPGRHQHFQHFETDRLSQSRVSTPWTRISPTGSTTSPLVLSTGIVIIRQVVAR